MIQTERESWRKSKSVQYTANDEHDSVSTTKRLRGEKRDTISLKSRAALSRGVRYQLLSNPLIRTLKTPLNRVSLLSRLCYYSKKNTFYKRKILKNYIKEDISIVNKHL